MGGPNKKGREGGGPTKNQKINKQWELLLGTGEYVNTFIDTEISNKKILFQDVIRKGVKSQILFTGYLFVILCTKRIDCTHGVDRNSSIEKK